MELKDWIVNIYNEEDEIVDTVTFCSMEEPYALKKAENYVAKCRSYSDGWDWTFKEKDDNVEKERPHSKIINHYTMNKEFEVSFTIDISARTPEEAAAIFLKWLKEPKEPEADPWVAEVRERLPDDSFKKPVYVDVE